MVSCKLCLSEIKEGHISSADPKMCKQCYKDLAKYKRLVVKNPADLPPSNLKLIRRMELMFKHNASIGGYTPRCYEEETYKRECCMCGNDFDTVTNGDVCHPCRKREKALRSLLYKNPNSKSLDFYHDYYMEKYKAGYKIPKPALELIGKA